MTNFPVSACALQSSPWDQQQLYIQLASAASMTGRAPKTVKLRPPSCLPFCPENAGAFFFGHFCNCCLKIRKVFFCCCRFCHFGLNMPTSFALEDLLQGARTPNIGHDWSIFYGYAHFRTATKSRGGLMFLGLFPTTPPYDTVPPRAKGPKGGLGGACGPFCARRNHQKWGG